MLPIDQACSFVSSGWRPRFKLTHPALPSSGIPSIGASRTEDLIISDESLEGLRATGDIPKVRYVDVSSSQSAIIPRGLNSSFWAATS